MIPELPQPGNAGNGWQFPGGENLTVCRNMEPWHDYCEEPPCGQVRRTNSYSECVARMSHRKWRETKQQTSRAR